MISVEYILCHGSSNSFVMIDAVRWASQLVGVDMCRLVQSLSAARSTDGVLLLQECAEGGYEMVMYNPDGTRAQMCGNGIRCVARLARGYVGRDEFVLHSGGRPYAVSLAPEIFEGVESYSVEIGVELYSPDFAFFGRTEQFVAQPLPQLDSRLRFTALSLGNPHIVAQTDRIDISHLEELGRRVLSLPELFPCGVNVSLYVPMSGGDIFVATCERGAGITYSCGTAMTASATAAALTGVVEMGQRVKVYNRGGVVWAQPKRLPQGGLLTSLSGNATFVERGVFDCNAQGDVLRMECRQRFDEEQRRYAEGVAAISETINSVCK